jgi:hypothetical protein
MRRFRHVRQPVLVLFLILGFVAWPEPFSVGDTSPAPDDAPWFVEAMLECSLIKEELSRRWESARRRKEK